MEVLHELICGIYEFMSPWFFDIVEPIQRGLCKIECIGSIFYSGDKESKKNKDNSKFKKVLGMVIMLIMFGHIYVAWLLIKWSCILTWRLFKKIFRIGR